MTKIIINISPALKENEANLYYFNCKSKESHYVEMNFWKNKMACFYNTCIYICKILILNLYLHCITNNYKKIKPIYCGCWYLFHSSDVVTEVSTGVLFFFSPSFEL